jgi:uncharacterized protein with PQ loop repeat
MEVIGWIGTVLVIVAYYPQIRHLWVEKCAWGISVWTWTIWLVASVLLLIYCIVRQEILLSVVQVTNMASIITTIALVRRSNNICSYHLSPLETGRQTSVENLTRRENATDTRMDIYSKRAERTG